MMARRRPAARRLAVAAALVVAQAYQAPRARTARISPLNAGFAALQRKAKEKEQRAYLESLPADHPVALALRDGVKNEGPRNNCRRILKRTGRGALGVVAEYNRRVPAALKMSAADYEQPDATLVSDELRAAGANVFAINMESVAGGCEETDLQAAVREQQTALNDFPGPLPIVWMDAVVDEVQLARAAVFECEAVTLNLETLGVERCVELKGLAEAKYGLEVLVVCAPRAAGAEGLVPLLNQAITEVKASVLIVGGVSFDASAAAVKEVRSDDLVLVARVDARDDQGLEEAEEAWDLRDAGYDAVWISDVLYKFGSFSGNLFASSPDTITSVVKAMKSKASTKFARASGAFSGKGEGAKEHLGDIMM